MWFKWFISDPFPSWKFSANQLLICQMKETMYIWYINIILQILLFVYYLYNTGGNSTPNDPVLPCCGNKQSDHHAPSCHCGGEVHDRLFSMKDVSEHCESRSCWVVVNNVVYDLTDFIYDVSAQLTQLYSTCTRIYTCSIHWHIGQQYDHELNADFCYYDDVLVD